ncbi:MAG: DEAD/DEAH box helicase [Phycisphaerae bacterium]
MPFNKLGLIEPLLRAVRSEGYTIPTPIQLHAIPPVLAGKDLLGCAQTGTGKTAAFALPILQRLSANGNGDPQPATAGEIRPDEAGAHPRASNGKRPVRALVLTPTRELAAQIHASFRVYGQHVDLRCAEVFGGVSQVPQAKALRQGVDILVATPGRLLDLMGQGLVQFKHLEVLVLDEADRMLDMGFIPDVRRILSALPAQRQTLFFSATMPGTIQGLADAILRDPVEVRVTPEAPAAETVEHSVYLVEQGQKQALLEHLLAGPEICRALVFTRTKHGAEKVARRLKGARISADAIHGNKSQGARERSLDEFKRGRTRVLVASDLASRGLDVDDISHVINFDMPREAETYVHRIGRTGRAGASGTALSFCSYEERNQLNSIERLMRQTLGMVEDHPFRSPLPRMQPKRNGYISVPKRRGRRGGVRGRRR